MDVLKYKTVTGADGATSVSTGGLALAQIIKVSRQGEQKDKIPFLLLANLNGSNWTFINHNKRIFFGSSYPFVGSEEIHIIYKETL